MWERKGWKRWENNEKEEEEEGDTQKRSETTKRESVVYDENLVHNSEILSSRNINSEKSIKTGWVDRQVLQNRSAKQPSQPNSGLAILEENTDKNYKFKK